MQMLIVPLLLVLGLVLFAAPVQAGARDLTLPAQGSASERALELWQQTRPILMEDASRPHADPEWLALGSPLVASWNGLQTQLGGESSEVRAVLKLLNDVYGRPAGTPERRTANRRVALQNLSQLVVDLEGRLRR